MNYCCYGLLALLSLSVAAMPEPEFAQLDSQIRPLASQSYPAAIAKVDEILAAHLPRLSTEQHIKLLFAKAWFTYQTGNTLQALALLARAKELSLHAPDPRILARYHNMLGYIFTDERLYQLAMQHLQQSQRLAQQLQDPEEQYDTGHSIGRVMLELGQYTDARDLFDAYLQHSRAQQSPAREAIALTSLGELAMQQGDLNAARQYHQQALQLRRQHKLNYHISFSLHNLARLALATEQWTEAEQLLRQVMALRADHQPRDRIAPGLDLALALQGRQQLAAAAEQLQQSIRLAIALKDDYQLSKAWQIQTHLSEQQQDHAQAVVAMRQAMQAQQRSSETMFQLTLAQASAELGLSNREAQIGRLQAAQQQQQQAQTARERLYLLAGLAALLLLTLAGAFSWQIRRKNQALAHSLTELTQTRRQLIEAEKMAALTRLVSGMAHQLNTPLGTVITAISCVDAQLQQLAGHFHGKTLNASQLQEFLQQSKDVLQLAQHNSDRAAALIERFKQIATQLGQQPHELIELRAFVLDRLGMMLHGKGVTLRCDGAPLTLTTGPLLLSNILQLWVDNALTHAFASQPEPQLWLRISSSADKAWLLLCDNGCGIAADNRSRVFEPFFTTRPGQGSVGLGLVIAYNSAHELGGQFSLAADPGGNSDGNSGGNTGRNTGACFLLELPR